MTMIESWLMRLAALFDKSAWLLVAPAIVALYFIDRPLALTFAQWGLFFLVLAGMAVVISRIVFPQIDLGDFLQRARDGNPAAGMVSAAVILFVGMLLLAAAVYWIKG